MLGFMDSRLEQLTFIPAAQMPHINRDRLSECLGLDQGNIRVISPDVGGGFGYKGILLPEEVCLSWLTMRRGHPVRWTEDRREHLSAGANCREHHYLITGYADRDGRLRGIDCEATVDSGAYSSYPFSACLEAAQVASILPGPYDFEPIAARPGRWRPTNARSCLIAAWPAPASALRWSWCSIYGARSRAGAGRSAPEESGAPRADAVRQHHQEAFRQRRLS